MPEVLVIPFSFLQGILDDDLDQFVIVGKDRTHTTWQVPGFKQAIRLPNDFVAKLSKVLRLKCVASWLQDLRGAILKAEESCRQIKEASELKWYLPVPNG